MQRFLFDHDPENEGDDIDEGLSNRPEDDDDDQSNE